MIYVAIFVGAESALNSERDWTQALVKSQSKQNFPPLVGILDQDQSSSNRKNKIMLRHWNGGRNFETISRRCTVRMHLLDTNKKLLWVVNMLRGFRQTLSAFQFPLAT